jgi:hypothetical protein
MVEFRFSDHFTAGMTIFTTGSQFVTPLHHPYWCMIQHPCMDAAAFNSPYCSLDVLNNTKTFSSHVFCTIRCHKLLWGCWRISLSFRKISHSVVPFNLWTLDKSALIPYRNISNTTVSGASHLHQAPSIIQWKSDIWFLNTEMWNNQCLHFL